MAAELPPARERAQRAVVELHVVQHVRGLDEVARGVVREVVHVAVRLLDAYQVVPVVVGVGRDIPKHVARPHHAAAPVVPPVAVQSVGEGEPYQFVSRVVRQCEGTPLAVGDAGQVTPCVIKALMADDTFCMYFVGNIELLSSQITDYAINSKLTEGLSLCNLLKQQVTSESAGISNEFSGRLFIFNCRRGCKLG